LRSLVTRGILPAGAVPLIYAAAMAADALASGCAYEHVDAITFGMPKITVDWELIRTGRQLAIFTSI
jgi:hypothetical protein